MNGSVGGSSISVTTIHEPEGILQAAVIILITKSHQPFPLWYVDMCDLKQESCATNWRSRWGTDYSVFWCTIWILWVYELLTNCFLSPQANHSDDTSAAWQTQLSSSLKQRRARHLPLAVLRWSPPSPDFLPRLSTVPCLPPQALISGPSPLHKEPAPPFRRPPHLFALPLHFQPCPVSRKPTANLRLWMSPNLHHLQNLPLLRPPLAS